MQKLQTKGRSWEGELCRHRFLCRTPPGGHDDRYDCGDDDHRDDHDNQDNDHKNDSYFKRPLNGTSIMGAFQKNQCFPLGPEIAIFLIY